LLEVPLARLKTNQRMAVVVLAAIKAQYQGRVRAAGLVRYLHLRHP
jgi:hypothetical protein|tara:strand:+ start:137 stop:274 length:138 start_codon:yes stop_codon:yes gene_type:complete